MIHDTLHKIEARLAEAETLTPETRAALETLLAELKTEIAAVDQNLSEAAESIAGFTESSTREALRRQQDPDLLDASLDGLRRSVREFELSHPKLTEVVNGICQQLSNIGI